MEPSENVYDKQNTLLALNMAVVAVKTIVSSEDRIVLEQQYRTIIDRLKFGNIESDEELVQLHSVLMKANTDVQLLQSERDRFLNVYDREQKRAVLDALKGPLAALPLSGALSWLTLGKALMKGANAFFGYRERKERLQDKLDASLWRLEREKRQIFDELQRSLLNAWPLMRKYGLPDEYRVVPEDLDSFEKALAEPNPAVARSMFAEQQKRFAAYPPFWFYYGESALQCGDVQKAEECFAQFDRTDRDILRKDAYKVQIAKYRISMNRNASIDYVKEQLRVMQNHLDDNEWLDYLFYGVVSFAIGEKEQGKNAVRHNINYNLEKEVSGAVLKAMEQGVQYLWAALARAFYDGKSVDIDKKVAYKYATLARLYGDKSVDDLLEKLEGTSGWFGKKAELSEADQASARAEAQFYYESERNAAQAALAIPNEQSQLTAAKYSKLEQDYRALQERCEKLRDAAGKSEDEKKHLAKQVEQLQKADNRAADLQRECDALNEKLKSALAESENAKQAAGKLLESERQQAAAQRTELEKALADAKAESVSRETTVARSEKVLQETEAKRAEWEEKYETLYAEFESVKRAFNKAQSSAAITPAQYAELEGKLTAANKTCEDLKHNLAEYAGIKWKYETQTKDYQALCDKAEKLEQKRLELEEQLADLGSKLNVANEKNRQLQADNRRLEEEKQTNAAQHERERQQAADSRAKLEQELHIVRTDRDEKQFRLEQLENERRQASDCCAELEKSLHEAQTECDAQREAAAKAEQLRDEALKRAATFDRMANDLAAAQAERDESRTEAAKARQERDEAVQRAATFTEMEIALAAARKEKEAQEAAVENARRERQEAVVKFAELDQRYKSLNAEYLKYKAIIDEQERVKRKAEDKARREAEEKERSRQAALEAAKKVGGIVTFGRYKGCTPLQPAQAKHEPKPEPLKETTSEWPLFIDDLPKIEPQPPTPEPPVEKNDELAPIEWLVLAEHKGRLLLISRYGLDFQQYHHENTAVTWEKCDLRCWLNNNFLNTAFNADERKKILQVRNPNPNNAHVQYGTPGGNATDDKVFLLSIDEANRFFKDDAARQCRPTSYAKEHGAWSHERSGNGWWWLRSPGNYSCSAASVNSDGSLYDSGDHVYSEGGCVRPALWVSNL